MEEKNTEELENKKENKITLKTAIIIGIIIIIGGFLIFAIISHITNQIAYNAERKNLFQERINDQIIVKKPIIYLYPEKTTELSVTFGKPENITCSYPKYNNGWNVIAMPDGTLIDTNAGRTLYSLYWEGLQNESINFNEGFVVKGNDTIQFLEEKLVILGLNEIEAEEFIVYWLPKLQENKYNLIRFATIDEINKNMPLEFSVKPDTLIRVLMQYKALDNHIEIKEQHLATPERTGFVVVEWGGTEIK